MMTTTSSSIRVNPRSSPRIAAAGRPRPAAIRDARIEVCRHHRADHRDRAEHGDTALEQGPEGAREARDLELEADAADERQPQQRPVPGQATLRRARPEAPPKQARDAEEGAEPPS